MMLTKKNQKGFSLMEVMIAVGIVVILTTTASISYKNHVMRTKRTEAIHTILAIQLAEEKYRSQNPSYGDITQVWNNVQFTTSNRYAIAISNVTPTSYTITLTAQRSQVGDKQDSTSCSTLSLAVTPGNEVKSPTKCWMGG